MTQNTVEGIKKQVKGTAQDVAGAITGDTGTQVKGKINKAVGKVQEKYGEAEDNA